jgi:exonuclease SbcD
LRFIHAADIHLDSPLKGLSAYPDAPAQRLRNATREAFTNLVTVAVDENVDFMVIAGDLYDGDWKDHNTGLFFVQEMGRLRRAGIPVYLLYGNHDAQSELTKRLQMPDNVHVFGANKPGTFRIDALRVALHGQSFKHAAIMDNLATGYPDPVRGYFNIGVLHTALQGNAAHDTYAPCSLDELHACGYDYWALGHVHEYSIWRGASTVVFPGNIQGRHVRETGARGAVLVGLDEDGGLSLERRYVDVLRWHLATVDVSSCLDYPQVAAAVQDALESLLQDQGRDRPMAVRVVLAGETPAHGALFGLEAQLRADVLAAIAVLGNDRYWLEKVVLDTREPAMPRVDTADGALTDVHRMLASASRDPLFLDSLKSDLMGLVGKTPRELHASVPHMESIRHGELRGLVDEVQDMLAAYLDEAD